MPRRAALLWALVWALVALPALGLVHGVAHGPQQGDRAAVQRQVAHAPALAGFHWLKALFAGHDGDDGSCRLYDQLTHDPFVPFAAAPALPLLPTAFLLVRLEREAVARAAALFEARGPPVLR